MAAARHHTPAPDVAMSARRQRAWRTQDLARKVGISRRNVDRSSFGNGPRPVHARVIRPERRADRTGEPVEADIGKQAVAAECGFDVAAAIRPGAKLLDDPGGEAGRRVGQPEGKRLGPRSLEPLKARLLSQTLCQLIGVRFLFGRGIGCRLLIAPDRQQIYVDSDQLVGMGVAEARGGDGTPIAALHGKAGVAQGVAHQLGRAVGDLFDAEARLPGFEGQSIARERGCDDGERIRGIATEPRRVSQPRDQLEELEDRTRPPVHQQERAWRRPFAGYVQEVEIDAAQRHLVLREGIEPRLLGPPIERRAPIFDELPQIADIGAVGPGCPGGLVRISRPRQSFAQIHDGLIRNGEGEGLRLSCHLDLVASTAYSAAMLCRPTTSRATLTRSALPDPRSGSLSTTITSAGAISSDAPLALAYA